MQDQRPETLAPRLDNAETMKLWGGWEGVFLWCNSAASIVLFYMTALVSVSELTTVSECDDRRYT